MTSYDDPELTLDDEVLYYRARPVGVFEDSTVILNLGWCRLAGLSVRIEDDPKVDRHRDGLILDRPAQPRPRGPGSGE